MFLSLYKIVEESANEYKISLDKDNIIFKVHFDGNPVLPGACMTEISRELIEKKLNKKLSIKNIKNLKFMQIVSPTDNQEIIFYFEINNISQEEIQAKIQISNTAKDITFAKMSIILQYD